MFRRTIAEKTQKKTSLHFQIANRKAQIASFAGGFAEQSQKVKKLAAFFGGAEYLQPRVSLVSSFCLNQVSDNNSH